MSSDDMTTDPADELPISTGGSSQTSLQVEQASQATQLSVAMYVESMAAELRAMADVAGLSSLCYFLDMVRVEASIQVTTHAGDAPPDSDRRQIGCRSD